MSEYEIPFRNAEYPFQSRFFDAGGVRMHYLDEGQGEPILLLHGNPTWSFFYRKLIVALRKNYRVIVPDHIGSGFSEKPDDSRYDYHLHRRANDIAALVDHLGIRGDITLGLHDWGGMIGMTFAHRHPSLIRRIMLFNTSAFHKPKAKGVPAGIWIARTKLFGAIFVRGLNLFCRGAAADCAIKPLSPHVKEAFLAPYDSWANRIGVHRFVQDAPLTPGTETYNLVTEVDEHLSQFSQLPMLICWGQRDFVFDDHFLREWIRRFPEAQIHRFPNAGHYVLEDAGTEIVPIVERFLADDRGSLSAGKHAESACKK